MVPTSAGPDDPGALGSRRGYAGRETARAGPQPTVTHHPPFPTGQCTENDFRLRDRLRALAATTRRLLGARGPSDKLGQGAAHGGQALGRGILVVGQMQTTALGSQLGQ